MGDDRDGQQHTYRIEVHGRIDRRWADWLGRMEIITGGNDSSPISVLTGPVADQSALRGLLTKIWDLNLVVISVHLVGRRPERLDGMDTTERTEEAEG